MAVVEPYSPCPCGSGQKFKWCCQKAEAFADKAQRLYDGGQSEAALATLDEGLRKFPANPWLSTRMALIFLREGQGAKAKPLLEGVIRAQPGHVGAHGFLLRVLLETDGPVVAARQLQSALQDCAPELRGNLSLPTQLIALFLGRVGMVPAALRHYLLAASLSPNPEEDGIASAIQTLEADVSHPPWLRNPDELSGAPEGLQGEARRRFEEAYNLAAQGLWQSGAAAFEPLSAERVAEAHRNLGLCRLWMADDEKAVVAFRKYIVQAGETEETVDLEALCQLIEPLKDDHLVDQCQLTWPIRNRERLLKRLEERGDVADEGPTPLDPDDPESVEVEGFVLLDQPIVKGKLPQRMQEVPRLDARILVGPGSVAVEAYDDGRLDAIRDRFLEIAGDAIPPAQPKTKEIGKASRVALAMSSEWYMPEGVDEATVHRFQAEDLRRKLFEVWPNTPMPYLKNRTPLKAAADGDARIALRAGAWQLQVSEQFRHPDIDYSGLRRLLRLEDEPAIDPETVDIEGLHISRLGLVPADRLDDDRLLILYRRAREYEAPGALDRATLALIDRPAILEARGVDRFTLYSDQATLSLVRRDLSGAFAWVEKGRSGEPASQRAANAPRWDMLTVRLRARSTRPEEWVPELAIVLERYRQDKASSTAIMSALLELRLVQFAPNPDRPGDVLLDSRPLQMLLAEYGPKVTTPSGGLGISAAKGGIWTPGGAASGSGGAGIWTPGSSPSGGEPGGGGEKPKLIITGR